MLDTRRVDTFFGLLIVAAVYVAITAIFMWRFWASGLTTRYAWAYSVDTMTCRGRLNEPTVDDVNVRPAQFDGPGIRELEDVESLIGHAAFPLVLGVVFSFIGGACPSCDAKADRPGS
jgi:hypothetical protein